MSCKVNSSTIENMFLPEMRGKFECAWLHQDTDSNSLVFLCYIQLYPSYYLYFITSETRPLHIYYYDPQ